MRKEVLSNFDGDYKASVELSAFLDRCFYPRLCKLYNDNISFHRMTEYDIDYKGADLLCTNKDGAIIPFDEKATLDYISKERPLSTFAFELGFLRDGYFIEGWLTNREKLTKGYVLVWPYGRIDPDMGLQVDLAEIMLIRRRTLLSIIHDDYGYSIDFLRNEAVRVVKNNDHDGYYRDNYGRYTGRVSDDRMIKFVHSIQKNERPLNVIIKKDVLAKAAREVYWMKSGHRLKRIKQEKYYSPDRWSDVDAYFE